MSVPKPTQNFEAMAKKREREARFISDAAVYKNVVQKIVQLDVEIDMKVEILSQAIPDIGIIFGQLRYQYNVGNIEAKDYHDILEKFISKMEREKKTIDFDPTKYSEE